MYDTDFDEEEYLWRREQEEYRKSIANEREECRQEAQINYEACIRAGLI